MDDSGHRENGRHKQDQYKGLHSQWLIPTHMMKDQYGLSIKFMTIMTERDTALQERDLALSEKRAALAERDTAILQRDAAINERNTALMERDNAIAAYEHQENAKMNCSGSPTSQSKFGCSRGTKHMYHHPEHGHHPSHSAEAPCHTREMHIVDAIPISASASQVKPQRDKRTKETKVVEVKKNFKPLKKFKKGGEDLNRQIIVSKPYEWKTEHGGCGEDLNKDAASSTSEWKDQDLGLNQVVFDDSTMPIPVCSCTGTIQQCYKWGNGGWQSACCTTTLSMYPLPMMPNRRHARVGGRKMSGSAFTKLLSRLAAQGHDLSAPLDLKEHWAKHGTNRYITIK